MLYGLANLSQDPKVKERTVWGRRKSSCEDSSGLCLPVPEV